MKKTTGFFEEDSGQFSMMRLMSAAALLFLFGFDIYYIWYESRVVHDSFVYLNLVFLIAAFFPKVLQKVVEEYFSRLTASPSAPDRPSPVDPGKPEHQEPKEPRG